MATESGSAEAARTDPFQWLSGAAGGLIGAVISGVVIQFGFDPAILATGIPSAFGLSGLTMGWVIFLLIGIVLGLVYAAVATLGQLRAYAIRPQQGVYLGLAYGVVLWVLALIIVPLGTGAGAGGIGQYAVNLQGVLSFALLGIIIGLAYGVSPYTR